MNAGGFAETAVASAKDDLQASDALDARLPLPVGGRSHLSASPRDRRSSNSAVSSADAQTLAIRAGSEPGMLRLTIDAGNGRDESKCLSRTSSFIAAA